MNKKDKNNNNHWLTFNIEMPQALIPLYDFLQSELNRILADEKIMEKVRKVDLNVHKGEYWKNMNYAIGTDTSSEWDLGANAWYARMIYENIRRILTSGTERRAVHDILTQHDNEVSDEFWKDLHKKKIFPAHGTVRNVQREISNGNFTDVPTSATFVMDYSNVSDTAIERKISKRRWLFRSGKDSWLDIEIFLPGTLRAQATGKIAKPRFVKRASDGRYVGCVSYEVKADKTPDANRVFGVDLGIVKPFSGSALGADGIVSSEYVISRRTQRLVDKYERVCESLSRLVEKQGRCEHLIKNARYDRREEEIAQVREKKRNLRTEIVRFVAFDIVLAALSEDCGEVHVEELSWLDSRGGYWNHAEVQAALFELAPVFGLSVHRVSAAYSSTSSPFGDEVGVERGRDVVFGDGWVVDRDFLASVNLAVRPVERDGERRRVDESLRSRGRVPACRVRRSRRECLGSRGSCSRVSVDYSGLFRGGTDVVVFSAGVGGLPPARSVTVTARPGNIASNSNQAIMSGQEKPT